VKVKNMTEKKVNAIKDLGWLKGLLNNLPLLKWVKKYSADNLMADNKLATKWGIKTSDESISIGDQGLVKMLVTNSRYEGSEHIRFNTKHIFEVLKEICKEGELIISKGADGEAPEMFLQTENSVIVISSLGKGD
jgi:hypothetical protein